jgi:hypothetical protein
MRARGRREEHSELNNHMWRGQGLWEIHLDHRCAAGRQNRKSHEIAFDMEIPGQASNLASTAQADAGGAIPEILGGESPEQVDVELWGSGRVRIRKNCHPRLETATKRWQEIARPYNRFMTKRHTESRQVVSRHPRG